ncbi:MAG: ion transporter [Phycisphaeraceae bacterium]|nr:ion transporter [Phycisphaeraceae bacterium]
MQDWCRKIVNTKWFDRFILGVILAAAAVVGLETDRDIVARHGDLLYALDAMILGIFVVEALMKMAQHGRHFRRYFDDPWNIFDFTIVAVCLLPLGGPYVAVIRLARVLRTLRLISNIPRLQLLVSALIHSLPSMVYVGMLLGILFYVYAVLGVFLFGANDPGHFGTLPRAMMTLIRIVTLEDWTDVMYIQVFSSELIEPELAGTTDLPVEPRGQPILGAIYCISFVLLGTMIMLNLFIGVIINSMKEAQDERAAMERKRNEAAFGHISIADELHLMEAQFLKLQEQLIRVRTMARVEDKGKNSAGV